MTDIFTWRTQAGTVTTETGNVASTKFGDGYGQDVPDGINALSRSFPFTYSGSRAEVLAIRAFLRAHLGRAFFWTPPDDAQGYYKSKTWTYQVVGINAATISATFDQSFSP